jgi:hypothetical protein
MAQSATRWRGVGASMAAGAIYDLAFAFALFAALRPAAYLLRLPVPDDPVYLRFIGVFLAMLAAMYLLAARHPQRYQGVIVVAAAGRAGGFAYLAWAWLGGRPTAFLVLAVADLAFGLAHAVLLLRARQGEPEPSR